MASLQLFKIRINNACKLVKSHEAQIEDVDVLFTFPTLKEECEQYIKEKMGLTTNLLNSLHNAVKLQQTQINSAIEYISARNEEKERDKLMMELSKHLEMESLDLEVIVVQWRTRIEFRQHELKEQGALLHCDAPSIPNQASSYNGQAGIPERNERQIKMRKPMLEIPTFSGNFREFNSFWTVFESLIHTDEDLSETDKFLFLKQALKGKAAATLSCIPVVGDRYQKAIYILKKHFDRSANMADILINEIEKLPRASDNPESCRETFEAIIARIIHLEQTGMEMNADRVWRRIIFSKFPESICTTALQKEAVQDDSFNVAEILNAIDSIISLRETISLTTETLFPTDYHPNNQENESITRREGKQYLSKPRRLCLCGQTHSPYTCQRYTTPEARRREATNQGVCWRCFARNHYTTPEARRREATNQGVCWRCFARNHNLDACTNNGICPKCKGPHHGSLCLSEARQRSEFSAQSREPAVVDNHQHSPAFWPQHDSNQDLREMSYTHVVQDSQQEAHNPDVLSFIHNQCVLQTASALIFNEAEWDYQPTSILLDSGAQRSFIRSGLCEELNLPVVRNTSFTTSGMGEQQEQFNSAEVHITLKSLHSSEKLKNLSMHTKQKLTTDMQTASLTEADLRFISDEKLIIAQDTLSPKSVSPDLIIGQDLLNLVTLHNDKVRKLPSGLTLTPTIFGYIISGTSGTTTTSRFVSTFGCISTLKTTLRNNRRTFPQHNERLKKPETYSHLKSSNTRTGNKPLLSKQGEGAFPRRTIPSRTKPQPRSSSKGLQSSFTKQIVNASIFSEARADRQRWLATIRSMTYSNVRSRYRKDWLPQQFTHNEPKRRMTNTPKRRHHEDTSRIRTPSIKDMVITGATTINPMWKKRKRQGGQATPNRRTLPVTTRNLCK